MMTHLSGERTHVQDPDSRGIFIGLSLSHSRSDIVRATFEGVSHSIAHAFSAFTDAGIESKTIRAIGGGTKNPIIIQAVSAILGRPQSVSDSVGAAFGDAAIAAFSIGHLETRSGILDWVATREQVAINDEIKVTLLNDHIDYQELYSSNRALAFSRAERNRSG
jgi:xylulokinase